MAKLAFTFTLLFFFFASSYARTWLHLPEMPVVDRDIPNSLPEIPVVDHDLSNSLTEADAKPTILLSSDTSETEPTTVVDLEPQTTDLKTLDSPEILPESETVAVDAIRPTQPLDFVSFRPINRHFRGKREFGFGVPHRRCRHHIKSMSPRFRVRDDMLVSDGSLDFETNMFRGGVRHIPARWVRFHHHHHHHHDDGVSRFPFEHDMFAKEKFKRPFFPVEVEVEEEEGKVEGGKEREEREEGGLMKRFRKFLNHF